ncbi:MAG: YhcH/YjgK/YiaL family protein [Candidatus Hydrogenedentes bacterium]|nr:YhcH/YjgK/YiaL family protein [Candidatus Hydrogenedentota bacterium]
MILDTLLNWTKYPWTGTRFPAAFEYLQHFDVKSPDGTYHIDGDNVFCMVQSYETTPLEGHEFEAHQDYADIQYLVSGQESIFWAPTPQLTVTKPYKPDIAFYSLIPAPTELVLAPGQFCVLFPQDAHVPCVMHTAPSTVRKAVIKVRL